MEFPSFHHHDHHYHHNKRYVPPPPNNISDGHTNLYPNRHHLHPPLRLPPPPLPFSSLPAPPPPPPPLPAPPPPPSYNPHQSNFTFLDPQTLSFHNQRRSSPPQQPRFSNQSHRFVYQTDSWSDPHRIPPQLPQRNPISPDDHHSCFYSSTPQSQSYYNPNGAERGIPSSRYRDDTIIDGYSSRDISNLVSQDPQIFRGSPVDNDHHGPNIDRFASSHSATPINEATGSSSRNLEDFVEKYEPLYITTVDNDRIWTRRGNEDARRDASMKGEMNEFGHRGRDGVSELSLNYEDRMNKFNRGREGREEFKQVQKKSVLLRIGKPNNTFRNRNHEQHFSKAYLVESNNNNFRGKDKDKDHVGKDSSYLDQRMEVDREHSPVELDVSFKSNGLVAKAVVTPSSPVIDNSYTQPRDKKLKRATDLDSPSTKVIEGSTRSGSSSHGLECSSSSEKPSRQPRDKDYVCDGVNGSVFSSQGGGTGGSARPLSFRLRKKRKLVNLGSRVSSFLLAEKDDKSVKGENMKDGPSAPIIPFPSLEELTMLKVDASPEAMVTEKYGSEIAKSSLHNVNSFGDNPTEKRTRIAHKVSTINDFLGNDLSQQLSQNEAPLNLESDTLMASTDIEVPIGGTDCSSPSHDQIAIQKCPAEPYDGIDAANKSNSLCTASLNMQGMTTVCMKLIDSCPEEIITVLPENDDAIPDVLRREEETNLSEGATNTDETIKLPEDGAKKSLNVVIDEDDATCSSDKSYSSAVKRKTEASRSRFNLTITGDIHENVVDAVLDVGSSLKEISADMVDITETAKMISALQSDHREPGTDETCLLPEDELPQPSSILSACADGSDMIVTDSNDKPEDSMTDSIIFTQMVSDFCGTPMLDGKSTEKKISDLNATKNDCDNSVYKNDASLNGPESTTITSHLEATGLLANTEAVSSQGSSVRTQVFHKKTQASNLPTNKLSSASAVLRSFGRRSSPVFTNSSKNNSANISKTRTWHRSTGNHTPVTTSVSIPPLPKQSGTGQNSYIRSGNTLRRKAAPLTTVSSVSLASRSSVYQLNSSGSSEIRNSTGPGSKVLSIYSRTGGFIAPVVRPKTPPLSGSNKLSECTAISLCDLPSLSVAHLPMKGNGEEAASPVEGTSVVQNVSEYHKLFEAPGDQNVTSSNSEGHKTLDEGSAAKHIQCLERKSNPLVAASNIDQSLHDLDKIQASSSDGYYKLRKNQLIRAPMGDGSIKTDVQKALKNNIKRPSVRGVFKKYKHLRFPSFWTLSSQSSGKDGASLRRRPNIFPWKRSRYGGNMMNVSASTPSNTSSSISRKLLHSRKREMVYTRSRHGFSLRMSKLLSVDGSSLKWSKSIERNSKRANEEATLAVAAAEKKKRDETSERKYRNNMPRGRIFRIGLVRYQMDPSRRTLQRISDEEPSTRVRSKEEMKKSYVRIGNGNQLVRNPKRRTRIFAYEKLRWSLHTARSRSAKKKKYCQFYTRFGQCNKEDGKCPYIHDSSKIAVCTKFLNDLCFDANCKLTHKVIPERMQDCCYYLQGFCSNEGCPYRHVNVNSAASICEGFLKGYCADGNECRKKHTYACPEFEATGRCDQGTKCKLHHPKNRNMGLKRKQHHQQQQKNARGRYFGFFGGSEEPMIPTTEPDLKDDDKLGEYIGLDFSDEVVLQTMVTSPSPSRQTDLDLDLDSDLGTGTGTGAGTGAGAASLIELTKPIGIMHNKTGWKPK